MTGGLADTQPLNVLSLFSGVGGLDLGLERAGMTVVGQVEIDEYCRRVLAKHWPEVPRHDDVRTAAEWWLSEGRPRVDLACGGFPCQDISSAGRRAGIIDGERSSLWTYFARTVRVLRPRYVLVENVSAILVRGLDVVAADLAEIGYDLQWDCVPAAAVGAPHRRDRWFGIAYPQRDQLRVEPVGERGGSGTPVARVNGAQRDVADANSSGLEGAGIQRATSERSIALADSVCVAGPTTLAQRVFANTEARRSLDRANRRSRTGGGIWEVESGMGRVVDGLPAELVRDRLKALGNAVVPQVAEYIGSLIVAHAGAGVS